MGENKHLPDSDMSLAAEVGATQSMNGATDFQTSVETETAMLLRSPAYLSLEDQRLVQIATQIFLARSGRVYPGNSTMGVGC